MIEKNVFDTNAVDILQYLRLKVADSVIHDDGRNFIKFGQFRIDFFQRFVIFFHESGRLHKSGNKIQIRKQELSRAFFFFVPQVRFLKAEGGFRRMKPKVYKFVRDVKSLLEGRFIGID